jgi:hypothetical protein
VRRRTLGSRPGRVRVRPGHPAADHAGLGRLPETHFITGVRELIYQRALLRSTRSLQVVTARLGDRAALTGGAFLSGEMATGWRLTEGALLDLGPHLLDLLDTAVGPIAALRATGDPRRWVELTCEHENGAVSQASLSGVVRLPRARTRVELLGPAEELTWDSAGVSHRESWPLLRAEFAAAVRSGVSGPLDAARGLRLQELIAVAGRSLP